MAKDKKTPSDVSKMIKDREVKLVDFKFTDLPGTWQHFTTTLTEYNEDIFTDGLGFDGSSIRGWKVINASDMLVIPDPTTAWIDIFNAEPTLSLICTIVDPITREPYDRDPRGLAEKAEAYLKSTGIADTANFGPEAEFFIFDVGREFRLLSDREHRSALEQCARRISQSRLQDPRKGRLFSGAASRHLAGHSQ